MLYIINVRIIFNYIYDVEYFSYIPVSSLHRSLSATLNRFMYNFIWTSDMTNTVQLYIENITTDDIPLSFLTA